MIDKKLLTLAIGASLLLVGCSSTDSDVASSTDSDVASSESTSSQESTESTEATGYSYVSTSEVAENAKNMDKYTFVLGSDTCGGCTLYKVTGLSVLEQEEGIVLDYIDLDREDNAEIYELLEDTLGHDTNQGLATPTTFFVEDGKIVEYVVGAFGYEPLMEQYGTKIRENAKYAEEFQEDEQTKESSEISESEDSEE